MTSLIVTPKTHFLYNKNKVKLYIQYIILLKQNNNLIMTLKVISAATTTATTTSSISDFHYQRSLLNDIFHSIFFVRSFVGSVVCMALWIFCFFFVFDCLQTCFRLYENFLFLLIDGGNIIKQKYKQKKTKSKNKTKLKNKQKSKYKKKKKKVSSCLFLSLQFPVLFYLRMNDRRTKCFNKKQNTNLPTNRAAI